MNDDTGLGQVANHGHVALFALVGGLGGFLLGNDLAGIAILRVRGDSAPPNPRRNNALVDTSQSGKSCIFSPSRMQVRMSFPWRTSRSIQSDS